MAQVENNVSGTFCSLQQQIQIRFEQRNLGFAFEVESLKSPASGCGAAVQPPRGPAPREMPLGPRRSSTTPLHLWLGCFPCTEGLSFAQKTAGGRGGPGHPVAVGPGRWPFPRGCHQGERGGGRGKGNFLYLGWFWKDERKAA